MKVFSPLPFGIQQRSDLVGRLEKDTFDVLIIGGGITGAGVFRDICVRNQGLRVGLIELQDFAEGTSSRSTKLIHGGLRYLEMFEFKLVFESVSERYLLSKLAPHLVKPLPFLVPIYGGDPVPPWKLSAGLWLYDSLALFRNYRNHTRLDLSAVGEYEPELNRRNLKGLFQYYDYQTDDARLTLENILGGIEAGGDAISRCELLSRTMDAEGKHILTVKDHFTNRTMNIRAKSVLNATGPWNSKVVSRLGSEAKFSLRPTKGTHLVFPKNCLPIEHAHTLRSRVDGRVFFALPWEGFTVLGTTDTDLENSQRDDQVTKEDADYLIRSVQGYFHSASELKATDAVSSWVGLRPLIAPLESGSKNASQVSREHEIWESPKGVFHVAGGKLTTYRTMAIELAEKLFAHLGKALGHSPTEELPLPGGLDYDPKNVSKLGSRWNHVLRLGRDDPRLLLPLTGRTRVSTAEILHYIRYEMALSVSDIMIRRSNLYYYFSDHGRAEAIAISKILQQELQWDDSRRESDLEKYVEWAKNTNAYRKF